MNEQTATPTNIPEAAGAPPPCTEKRQASPRRLFFIAFCTCFVLGGSAFTLYRYQNFIVHFFQPVPIERAARQPEQIDLDGPGIIFILPESPLASRIQLATVDSEELSVPILTVSGSVVARLAPGRDPAEGRWDFATPELATAYEDWIKARADVILSQQQLVKVEALVKTRIEYLKEVLTRLESLVKIGTEEVRTMASARNDLLQADIQGQKDIYEATNAVKVAERNRALLERQLHLAGIDPETIVKVTDGLTLVVAEIPESKIYLVHTGQQCEATFISFSEDKEVRPFRGIVGRIGPSVSKEKRTLRVTFELKDEVKPLLPGMYADVSIGTQRDYHLTVPTVSLLHVGTNDYVLVEESPLRYQIREVVVGEPVPITTHNKTGSSQKTEERTVIRQGLQLGEHLVAKGAILLKPIVVKSLAEFDRPY